MNTNTIRRITYSAGLMGSSAILLGCLFTGLAYSGKAGERFSLFNHFVSELGEVGVSGWASVFNVGLMIGGAAITAYMIGLALQLRGWWKAVFGLIGVVSGVSGALVGVVPMNNLATHYSIAMTFFNTGWMAVAVFSLYVLRTADNQVPRWLVVPGVFTVICFITFLILLRMPYDNIEGLLASPVNRPALFPLAFVEWLVILTVLVWVFLTSLYLWSVDRVPQKMLPAQP